MNYQNAQRSLRSAIVLRDCALWHSQRGFTQAEKTCRARMRIAAKNMVTSCRAMEAIAARQQAKDITPFSFQPLEAA
jgi:hypothetical protein